MSQKQQFCTKQILYCRLVMLQYLITHTHTIIWICNALLIRKYGTILYICNTFASFVVYREWVNLKYFSAWHLVPWTSLLYQQWYIVSLLKCAKKTTGVMLLTLIITLLPWPSVVWELVTHPAHSRSSACCCRPTYFNHRSSCCSTACSSCPSSFPVCNQVEMYLYFYFQISPKSWFYTKGNQFHLFLLLFCSLVKRH